MNEQNPDSKTNIVGRSPSSDLPTSFVAMIATSPADTGLSKEIPKF